MFIEDSFFPNDSFALFDVIFFLIFFLVIGFFIFFIISGIYQWSSNNKQPVLTVSAKLVTKRADTRSSSNLHHHDNGFRSSSSSTTYYVTFEVESRDRIEFMVTGQEYGQLAEGDIGHLTFQGTRYQGFILLKQPANDSR
ncbi:DUF2500 domain-containing protein [Alkalihalobacillus sp. 1P02AB]|uniref:DUF2500 domain-containing protein n=1 Tax=Alkalihalobacillus sp. 1P02AB TaxID=3132260 RepID=UPI0039A6098D